MAVLRSQPIPTPVVTPPMAKPQTQVIRQNTPVNMSSIHSGGMSVAPRVAGNVTTAPDYSWNMSVAPAGTGMSKSTVSTNNAGARNQIFTPQMLSPNDSPGGGAPSESDMINSEFNDFVNFLGDQENQARSAYGAVENKANADKSAALQSTAAEQELQATQTRDNERLNLQKVRQLLSDLDQRNAARLSISGGGSLADALASRYSQTAMQQVGGIARETTQVLEKANEFYRQKKTQIENTFSDKIEQEKLRLQNKLDQIGQDRRTAESQKNQARYDSWRNYVNSVNQAKIDANNLMTQYGDWYTKTAQNVNSQTFDDSANYDSYLNADNYNYDIPAVDQGNDLSYAPVSIGNAQVEDKDKLNQLYSQ